MLDLFSRGRFDVLGVLLRRPNRPYYLREIANMLNKKGPYYKRVLDSLVRDGVLLEKYQNGMRFFYLNKKFFLYKEIKSIVDKTVNEEHYFGVKNKRV